MGINGWYNSDNGDSFSSYTDFTNGSYTEFPGTVQNGGFTEFPNCVHSGNFTEFPNSEYTDLTRAAAPAPVKKKPVAKKTKKVAAKKVKKTAAKKPVTKRRKKGVAGKVVVFTLLAASVIVTASFLVKNETVQACTESLIDEYFSDGDSKESSVRKSKKHEEEAFEITEERTSYDKSCPAYEIAESIMDNLWCGDDINTAYEIFNWVHTNISYQSLTTYDSFEEAAYDGFTKRSGDCYVYFACSKMLLDIAGIPNLMVERYPVETNSHFWNLVQIDGLWYHCDATVFRDHPDMYFLCTDYEIDDGHHSFDSSLYPERASSYYEGSDDFYYGFDDDYYWNQPYEGYDEYYSDYDEYYFDDGYYYEEEYDPYDVYCEDYPYGYDDEYGPYVEDQYIISLEDISEYQ